MLNVNAVKTNWRAPNLEPNEEIARILLDPRTKQILDVTVYEENLRFECRRCATFCCKLGGPKLTKKDIERIAQAGYEARDFIVPLKDGSEGPLTFLGGLKSREDGSCIFLKFDPEREKYSCMIYDSRPALCRLYPFDFQKINTRSLMLRVIPCCRGLSTQNGAMVDERFIVDLFKAAREIL